jgi:hypothetical protein
MGAPRDDSLDMRPAIAWIKDVPALAIRGFACIA